MGTEAGKPMTTTLGEHVTDVRNGCNWEIREMFPMQTRHRCQMRTIFCVGLTVSPVPSILLEIRSFSCPSVVPPRYENLLLQAPKPRGELSHRNRDLALQQSD